jgi:hypothetical protein
VRVRAFAVEEDAFEELKKKKRSELG